MRCYLITIGLILFISIALFWAVRHRVVTIPYRRFRTSSSHRLSRVKNPRTKHWILEVLAKFRQSAPKISFLHSKMYRRKQECYTLHTFPNLLYFCVKNADLFHSCLADCRSHFMPASAIF